MSGEVVVTEQPLAEIVRRLHYLSDAAKCELSDDELLHLFVHEANQDAFAAIVRRHGPLVRRVREQLLPEPHDAEDARSRPRFSCWCARRVAPPTRASSELALWRGPSSRLAVNRAFSSPSVGRANNRHRT